jgi:hypothetical protein
MLIIFVVYYGIQFLLGNKKIPSVVGLGMCSDGYWTIFAIRIFLMLVFYFLIRNIMNEKASILIQMGQKLRLDYSNIK